MKTVATMIYRLQIFSIFISFFISIAVYGQQNANIKLSSRAARFIEAYNRQDYPKMKKSFFPAAQLLPLKKALRQEFEPRFTKYGVATIDSVEYQPEHKLILHLSYSKDRFEKDWLAINFNKRSKIIGLHFNYPDYLYPKNTLDIPPNVKKSMLDSLLKIKTAEGFNGNVLVVSGDDIIYKKSFGFANYHTEELLNDSSLFELASCSKQFTAMAIMILAEQGKINYSDNILKYIPDLPYHNITIENLLTHTSGLPDYMQIILKHWDKKKFATNYDIIGLFKKYKPKMHFKPNEKYEYSNTGYALLSVIIEKVSGLTYAEFLNRNIFEKLGMKNTRVYNTRRSKNEKIKNYAYGHVYSEKHKKFILPDSLSDYNFVAFMDAITGDGTVNTTVSDFAAWDEALREKTLVTASTLEKAFSKHKLANGTESNYGYGLFVAGGGKYEKVVYHGGAWPGYSTSILHFVDKPLTVIVLSNNEYNVYKLTDQIIRSLNEHGAH
ncbi:MAG: serine hydrolase domain-containing protein [Bacteroidia bacterium]